MTIKQVANEYNISVQAVYKRIRAAGYTLDSLKNKETGELTQEGEEAIKALFNREEKADAEIINGLKEQINQLKTEVEYLRSALERAQQVQGMILAQQALPPGKGFFARVFGRGKKQ